MLRHVLLKETATNYTTVASMLAADLPNSVTSSDVQGGSN